MTDTNPDPEARYAESEAEHIDWLGKAMMYALLAAAVVDGCIAKALHRPEPESSAPPRKHHHSPTCQHLGATWDDNHERYRCDQCGELL